GGRSWRGRAGGEPRPPSGGHRRGTQSTTCAERLTRPPPPTPKEFVRAGLQAFAPAGSDLGGEFVALLRDRPRVAFLLALGGPRRTITRHGSTVQSVSMISVRSRPAGAPTSLCSTRTRSTTSPTRGRFRRSTSADRKSIARRFRSDGQGSRRISWRAR